jgi:peptidoglycan/LPS O-acetylase OafA/YrhL
MTQREGNNFDCLRFLLASMVFLVHTHILTGNRSLAFFSQYLSSDYAVKGFFVISGFLVFQSYDRSRSLLDYVGKRVRRIYPAYVAIVMACAIGGAAITTLPLEDYLSSGLIRYIFANLAFLNFLALELPGVFQTNIIHAVNGALWSIKIEVMFYAVVPAIAFLFRRFGIILIVCAVYLASIIYLVALSACAERTGVAFYKSLAYQLPGQLAYFMIGAFLLHYGKRVQRWLPFAAAAALLVLPLRLPFFHVLLEPVLLGSLIIYLATRMRYFGNFGRRGDLSYGIYIVHFPIIQLFASWGLFHNAWTGFACAVVAVLTAAWWSWHFIEKPFLKRSSHYVVAANP